MKNLLFFLFIVLSTSVVIGQTHLYDPEPKTEAIKSIAQFYIKKERAKLENALKEFQAQGAWTKDELLYAKTVLQNLPKNASLITNGVADTYTILYVQTVEKMRPDVKLIPLVFYQYPAYRDELKAVGLNTENNVSVNAKLVSSILKIEHFSPIHIANTVPKDLFEQEIAHLYALGLSFRYATFKYKNSIENVHNWKKNFEILQQLSTSQEGKKLTPNFLPMLMNLHSYFKSENNASELEKVKEAMDLIGTNIQLKNLSKTLGI